MRLTCAPPNRRRAWRNSMSHADDGKVVQAAALLQASFRRSLR
jgi:hypothetical protein